MFLSSPSHVPFSSIGENRGMALKKNADVALASYNHAPSPLLIALRVARAPTHSSCLPMLHALNCCPALGSALPEIIVLLYK